MAKMGLDWWGLPQVSRSRFEVQYGATQLYSLQSYILRPLNVVQLQQQSSDGGDPKSMIGLIASAKDWQRRPLLRRVRLRVVTAMDWRNDHHNINNHYVQKLIKRIGDDAEALNEGSVVVSSGSGKRGS